MCHLYIQGIYYNKFKTYYFRYYLLENDISTQIMTKNSKDYEKKANELITS